MLDKPLTLRGFQLQIEDIYGLPDDRLYSLWDLLTQTQRFGMRALKGIRKNSQDKLTLNLLITFCWLLAISNRLHIDIEDEVWHRFPMLCSYCGEKPCVCKKTKIQKRKKIQANDKLRPKTLAEFQKMFSCIYPPLTRTLPEAGVHFAEEVGEVAEAVHNFLGQHLDEQFTDIKIEMADLVSCIFGLGNSAGIDISAELQKMFRNGCHVCHQIPCECGFTKVAGIKT